MTVSDDAGIAGRLDVGERITPSGLELVEELGRGAYATVYRALRGGEEYAVKVLNSSVGMSWSEGMRRLRREAGLLARVEHPGLTDIYEVGDVDGRPYLVMDYVSGTTLRQHLDTHGPMEVGEVLKLAATLAGALSMVHRKGIIHCDIKPDNIIFDARGVARLVDFGLAMTSGTYPREGFFAGTLRYASPEQAGSIQRPIDERADLYSLGVVIYEALCGAPPFEGRGVEELARAHAVESPPPIADRREGVCRKVEELVARLLDKDPQDRFHDAGVLLDRIRRLVDEDDDIDDDGQLLEVIPEQPSTFVGRHGLLANLRHRWMEVHRAGKGVIVELCGESGIGKRSILKEFSRRLPQSAPVLAGSCRKGGDLSVFQSLFEDLVEITDEEVVRDLVEVGEVGALLSCAYPALRPLIGEGGDDGDGPTDLLLHATTHLLASWAEYQGAAVMLVDDFEEADLASRRVLLRLRDKLKNVPLLVVLASRDRCELGEHLEIPALSETEVRSLLSTHFGGYSLPKELVSTLWERSRGLPVLVEEYVPLLIEEGVVEPHWGEWRVDIRALEAMSLPSDMASYVVGKLDGLSQTTAAVMETAAVIGRRFDSQVVQKVCESDANEVEPALMEGVETRLLRHCGGDEYEFVHEEVWTTLREKVGSQREEQRRRRALHQRIAEHLDGEEGAKVASPATLAHHYANGEVEKNPQRVFELNYEAGRRARRRHADAEALRYFEQAAEAANVGEFEAPADFEMAYGQICARRGRLDEAARHLRCALRRLDDPVRRSRIRGHLSWIHLANFEIDCARTELDLAFDELGESLPDSRLAQLAMTAGDWLSFQWKRIAPRRQEVLTAAQRRHSRCLSTAYDQAAYLAYVTNDDVLMAQAMIRPLRSAYDQGATAEAVVAYYNYAIFLAEINRPTASRRFADCAVDMATKIDDPRLESRARLHRFWAYHFAGFPRQAAEYGRRCLKADGQWLDLFDYLNGCMELAWNLLMRGYCEEALEWLKRADRRTEQIDGGGKLIAGHIYPLCAASLHTILGREKQGGQILDAFRRRSRSLPSNWTRRAEYAAHLLLSELERGEVGEAMEEAAKVYGEFEGRPQRLNLHYLHYYVFCAYAHMRRGEERYRRGMSPDIDSVDEVLSILRRLSSHSIIDAHRHVVEGAYHRWQGELEAAEQSLQQAESLACDIDAPWVDYEVALQKAYLARSFGVEASAIRWARKAYLIAMDGGWRERSERVRQAFADCAVSVTGFRSSIPGASHQMMSTTGYRGQRLHRYLDAVFEISRASTSTVDSDVLAEEALDSVVEILGCERALLFVGEKEEGLKLMAARDADNNTLAEDCGFSRTVVDHVWHTGESVVLSGSGEGVAFGSRSIVARDLRSVAATAISFRDELFGVLYLDSTLARGVFVRDDLDFLRAIATHLAIGVETARSAHMKANLEAERQRRKLAETLQSLNQLLSSTLDEDEVLARAVERITELISCRRGAIFKDSDQGWEVAATTGFDGHTSRRVREHYKDNLDAISGDRERPVTRDEAQARLVVTFFGREDVIGAMVLERRPPAGFDDRELRLAATVAGQVGMAQENARLYEEVRQLAMMDALTQVPNRRHFFDVASSEFDRARRFERPVAAVMIDVDHFKEFNDTHGHATADVVLHVVAQRCQKVLRSDDLFARYGGEEFVALLPDTAVEIAQKVGERLRGAVGDEPIEVDGKELHVTISVGVAQVEEAGTLDELLKNADDALYRAKAAGRNAVVVER